MEIAVLIKQVPVSNEISVDPDTHALIRASSEGMINPADLNAIELAIELKEKAGGKITVFSMGPLQAEKALREAMAIGCDEGCLITDRALAGGDTVATARVLAKALEIYGAFDLILSGALSSDGATGQVGAMVAECLGIPHVAEIMGAFVTSEGQKIEAVKKAYGDNVRVRLPFPALLTVNFGSNEPRLATLRSMRAAKKKPFIIYTNENLRLPPDQIGMSGSPTSVVDSFQPEGGHKAEILSGSAPELARKLHDLIEREREKA